MLMVCLSFFLGEMLEKLKITSPVLTWYQQFFKIVSESEVLHCNIGNGLQMLGNSCSS